MTAKFMRSGKVHLGDEQGEFADSINPVEILSWMDRHAEFEDGLTFRELLVCLAPWSAVVETIVGMDFDAWQLAASMPAPPVADDPRERVIRVEVRPSISVDRDDETMMAGVSIEWEVYGVLEEPDEAHGRTFEVVGLDLTHPSVYADLPLVIREEAAVSDVMTLGPNPPWNQEPAIHPTADGTVRGFLVYPNVVDTVLYGLLGDLTAVGSPDDAQDKLASIVTETTAIRAAAESAASVADTP